MSETKDFWSTVIEVTQKTETVKEVWFYKKGPTPSKYDAETMTL